MEETEEEKKDEADYKRLHSFPLIRVRRGIDNTFTSVRDMKICLHSYYPFLAE